jgi:hypothetical protein
MSRGCGYQEDIKRMWGSRGYQEDVKRMWISRGYQKDVGIKRISRGCQEDLLDSHSRLTFFSFLPLSSSLFLSHSLFHSLFPSPSSLLSFLPLHHLKGCYSNPRQYHCFNCWISKWYEKKIFLFFTF